MILALLPAVLIGLLLGRVWGGLYRPKGPRRQPGTAAFGLIMSVGLAWVTTRVIALMIWLNLSEGSLFWEWVSRLMPAYIPAIVAVAVIAAHMHRRKILIRHRAAGDLALQEEALPGSGVRDTPHTPGASRLG